MLRRQADRILINSIDPTKITNVTVNVEATVEGYGTIEVAKVIGSHKTCETACTARVVDVTVIIPTSCECPYEWPMVITCLPILPVYEVQTTFPKVITYGYEDPSGGTPTAADTATAIIAQITADPFACVTATSGGAGVITLTGKCPFNFQVFTPSGTIVETTPYVAPVLDGEYMSRLFPIRHGLFGAQPNIPVVGESYCEYHFRMMQPAAVQDVDGASHFNDYEQEVYFYVRSGDASFAAFDGPIAGLIPAANGGTL